MHTDCGKSITKESATKTKGLNKQTMVVNTNHALAGKVLAKEGDGRNELLQYCMDLAMLQRGQLQGESLERFVKKAQGFIMD